MNILIISPYYAPAWAYGGPPRILHELSRYLLEKGHRVTVFTTNVNDADSVQPEIRKDVDGADVYYFPNLSNKLAFRATIFLPLGLKKQLRERIEEFDIVLLSDARSCLNAIAYKYLKKYRIPYFHLAYGSLPIVGSGIKRVLKKIYDRIWMKNLLGDASVLVAQTEHERQEYMKLNAPSERVQLIPLATDHGLTNLNTVPLPENNDHQIKPTDKVLVSVGRINKLKTSSIMIDVLEQLVEQDPNYKWVLIGRDDGYLDTIHDEISRRNLLQNYCFTGPLYGDEKVRLLRRADCFFLAPCHFEETSTAALEALAYGTPCVITEQCEVPYMHENNAGFITRYDKDELVTAIQMITSRPKTDYSQKCIQLIQDYFTWEKVGDLYENLMLSAIRKNKDE